MVLAFVRFAWARFRLALTWAAVIVLVSLAVYAFVREVLTRSYPIRHRGFVAEAATQFDTDPFLILSVIKIESGFDSMAKSPKGAIGLMQVMPETAEWIVREVRPVGLEWVSDGSIEIELRDPRRNILIGSWYLSYLRQRFGDIRLALAAYNCGQGRVSTWLQEKQVRAGEGFSVDDIPIGETREFVRRVLAVREWYGRLYSGRGGF